MLTATDKFCIAPDQRLWLVRFAKRISSTRIAYACNGFIGIHRLASLSAAALVIAVLAFRTTTEVSSGFREHVRLIRALRNTAHTLSANRPFARTGWRTTRIHLCPVR